MINSINFLVHQKSIEINDQEFLLGEMTTDFLNITVDEYQIMKSKMELIHELGKKYVKSQDLADWWELNNILIEIDDMLMQHKIFQVLRPKDLNILHEARMFTEQVRIFPPTDLKLTESDLESLRSDDEEFVPINMFGEPLDPEYEHPPIPMTDVWLIAWGSVENKWHRYVNVLSDYETILHDICAFNQTIQCFINDRLSSLVNLCPSNYAGSLINFYNSDRAHKYIVNPVNNKGFIYRNCDSAVIRHVPREVKDKPDTYDIYEWVEVKDVQAFVRMDFMKCLMAGHIIRRCKHCRKYFMLTKAYHTMYCDRPSPEYSKYTCHQVGSSDIKEKAGNIPKTQSLKRALDRIDKDCQRGNISKEDKEKIIAIVLDLHNEAITSPTISNQEFEDMLQTKVLFPKHGIIRTSKPRGRPKKAVASGDK